MERRLPTEKLEHLKQVIKAWLSHRKAQKRDLLTSSLTYSGGTCSWIDGMGFLALPHILLKPLLILSCFQALLEHGGAELRICRTQWLQCQWNKVFRTVAPQADSVICPVTALVNYLSIRGPWRGLYL